MLIVAHGGAGTKRPNKKALKKLEDSLKAGFEVLKNGGPSLDAVITTIAFLEDSGIFNAGSGGNLQLDGVRRLDASLMEGRNLDAGSVIGLEGIKNPVRAARIVMDLPHKIMTNIGAKKIAEVRGLEKIQPPDEKALKRLEAVKRAGFAPVRLYEEYFSTVGAVALDNRGDLAAGSSTGGVAAMLPGRVGDTPLIGAGIYAENGAGAVSCTGRGEDILRLALAKEICMGMGSATGKAAAAKAFRRLEMINGRAGIIGIDKKGRPVLRHNTENMPAGYMDNKGVKVEPRW